MTDAYFSLILDNPWFVLGALFLAVVFFGFFSLGFEQDASLGKAIYYSPLTIIAEFSILALSKFIPMVCFGILTSLEMLIPLVGAPTLLSHLLVVLEPFRSCRSTSEQIVEPNKVVGSAPKELGSKKSLRIQ